MVWPHNSEVRLIKHGDLGKPQPPREGDHRGVDNTDACHDPGAL